MGKTSSKNERKTEGLARDILHKAGYNLVHEVGADGTLVEEQQSSHGTIARLLKCASKTGGNGNGRPEFIIRNSKTPDLVILVECKAQCSDHASDRVDAWLAGAEPEVDDAYYSRAVRYASDGVLHYAKAVSKGFNVIAVSVSGETKKDLTINTYIWTKGSKTPVRMMSKNSNGTAPLDQLLSWADMAQHASFDPTLNQARVAELMAFARELHDDLRVFKLTEAEKPLLVSGTLLALQNRVFKTALFGMISEELAMSAEEVQTEWKNAIQKELNKAKINDDKKNDMMLPYASLAAHPSLRHVDDSKHPKGVLFDLIERIDRQVAPFVSAENGLDILGQFYGEFLKYTGGDKKALGIVLTPRHITDLFADIANVNHKKSVVVDLCAGTGGFLISAMARMLKDAKTAAEEARIKEHALVGVEQQANMFALAASNMILRGDGKANLFNGDCFAEEYVEKVRRKKPNIGMLNPPYAQEDKSELEFIEHMLDLLEPNGTGVAIVPMSCALKIGGEKKSLLAKHTLEAVMSMPDTLFAPVSTVACIMVFTAHIPHADSAKDTWFGFWKDDGFVKTKHQGRVDRDGTWPLIRKRWLDAFKNRRAVPGECVLKQVGQNDEWCAEAYMDTDYSILTKDNYEREIHKYLLFQLSNEAVEKALQGRPCEQEEVLDEQ